MPHARARALATVAALVLSVGVPTIAPSHADPLPDVCVPASVADNVCTARLTSVTADAVNGTITGTPVGSRTPITLAGQGDAYLKSAGFGDAAPAPTKQWDATIDSVGNLAVDQFDPNWYGNAKTRVFMPRTLNGLATQFPPDTLLVSFTSDDARPDAFQLVSIQPTTVS
jgi:hypothetical protein